MKTGELLFDHIKWPATKILIDSQISPLINSEETTLINNNSEPSGDNRGAENGLKTGALLFNSLSNSQTKIVSDSQISLLINSESTALLGGKSIGLEIHPASGSKTDALLFNTLNSPAKAIINENGVSVEEDFLKAQIKASDSKSGDSKVINKEIFNQSNPDNKQNHVKTVQSKGDMVDLDSLDNNNSKTLTDKLMFEAVENFSRENGSKIYTYNTSKLVRINPEIDNANLINNSNITYEGSKTSESLLAGNTTRPSGFNALLDKIFYVVKGNNRLGVTVEHDNLGRLNINLSLDKGVVNVHINTSDKAVREFVESNIQYIVDSLAKNGVSVGGFSVALKDHKDNPGNVFIMDNGQKKEFIKEPEKVRNDRGLVNIFI